MTDGKPREDHGRQPDMFQLNSKSSDKTDNFSASNIDVFRLFPPRNGKCPRPYWNIQHHVPKYAVPDDLRGVEETHQ